MYRDHSPVRIDKFNGLWRRGDNESAPLDHFTDCNNLSYFEDGWRTRDGIAALPVGDEGVIPNVVRIYTYIVEGNQSLLALDTVGNIFHTGSPTPLVPILSITGMLDFAFVAVNGRAYLSPHNTVTGLEDEFVYVYLGDGDPARKAAGERPTGTAMVAANGGTLNVHLQAGIHIFGVVYETNTGFRTKIGPDALTVYTATGAHKCDLSNIPVSPDSFVVARYIVASKTIDPVLYAENPDPNAYELFLLPGGRIDDNTTTTLSDIDYFDSELLESAANLLDLREEIPAVVNLNTYHSRMIAVAFFGEANSDPNLDTYSNVSTALISNKGEPEAFNSVDGLITAPLDGNPLTNCQEYRDILYLFKKTRTYAYNDNGEMPETWQEFTLDQGLGASIHGVGVILDSGGVNVDFIVLVNFAGIFLFNGSFIKPGLSWKIDDEWQNIPEELFWNIQALVHPIGKMMFFTVPQWRVEEELQEGILYADYSDGLDEKSIKWCPWTFANQTSTIAILDKDNSYQLVIGSRSEI